MHSQPIDPHRGQSWKAFLKNHSVWACDFLQLYDIWYRPLFAFFIVNVNVVGKRSLDRPAQSPPVPFEQRIQVTCR